MDLRFLQKYVEIWREFICSIVTKVICRGSHNDK